MDPAELLPLQFDDLGWELSQALCFYAQMYIVPLVLMGILSVVTVYRREMSCNRVYALQDEEPLLLSQVDLRIPSQQQQQPRDSQQSTAETETGGSATTGAGAGTGAVVPFVASMLSWVQFDRGADHEAERALLQGQTATARRRTTRTSRSGERSTTLSGWSQRANRAVGKLAAASLPEVIRMRLAESSFIGMLFPLHRGRRGAKDTIPLHPEKFPADVQVNIFSFLHPKDVATFACVSRACRELIDGQAPTTKALWKTLWQRDYGWLMQSWDIGREVYQRSNVMDPPFGKEFYFRFGLAHVNYLLAGLNKPEKCLIGLHGCLYDITNFVTSHPGSPDTLLVHSGRDASKLFDDMDHSKSARRLAAEFCISVNVSTISAATSSFGSKPTIAFEADGPIPAIIEANPVMSKKQRRMLRTECLERCYQAFTAEEKQQRKRFRLKMKADKNVLDWNVFYDPFQGAWKVWYTNRDFETVFV